jgi:hypothetical protein
MRAFRSVRPVGGIAILVILLGGCGGDPYQTAEVTGHVLCNGKPAVGGVVTFEPLDAPDKTGRPQGAPGRMSSGTVGEDGSFSVRLLPGGGNPAVEGAMIGPHRVSFILPNTRPVEISPEDRALPPEHLAIVKEQMAEIGVYQPLDCGATITPSEVEVLPDGNEFEFTLGAPSPGERSRRPVDNFGGESD